jgi:hypothetical protein
MGEGLDCHLCEGLRGVEGYVARPRRGGVRGGGGAIRLKKVVG